MERVDKEHVRCVTAFQEAMSGPSGVPNRAMGGATAADGLSSKSTARENPPEPPREVPQPSPHYTLLIPSAVGTRHAQV